MTGRVSRFVESNMGHPDREGMEQTPATQKLLCSLCGQEAVRLHLPEGKERLVVASALRRFSIARGRGDPAVASALDGNGLNPLHQLLEDERYDGLDFYCPECDQLFCEDHWDLEPYFDEGFYDFTEGTCPKGHKRIVDD